MSWSIIFFSKKEDLQFSRFPAYLGQIDKNQGNFISKMEWASLKSLLGNTNESIVRLTIFIKSRVS